MKSLFNSTDSQAIIDRIGSLRADTSPQWGKMNVAQMLRHCQMPMRVALGEVRLKRTLIGILFGRIAKKKLTSPEPMPRNLPTDKGFIVVETPEFDAEKQKLIDLIRRFQEGGPKALVEEVHPFFGKLTVTEWDILQWNHLDHHLRQFGA